MILKFRPLVSTLENVPEAAQDAADTDEANDLPPEVCGQIKKYMEAADFSVVWAVDDAVTRGSLCVRRRIFPIIVDIHPEISEKFKLETNFKKVWNALKMPESYSWDCFALLNSTLVKYCRSLKHSTDIGPLRKGKDTDSPYADTHEALFSYVGAPWPPAERYEGFRPREGEVISLANSLFPPEDKVTTFFDANHSAERTFRWMLANACRAT